MVVAPVISDQVELLDDCCHWYWYEVGYCVQVPLLDTDQLYDVFDSLAIVGVPLPTGFPVATLPENSCLHPSEVFIYAAVISLQPSEVFKKFEITDLNPLSVFKYIGILDALRCAIN